MTDEPWLSRHSGSCVNGRKIKSLYTLPSAFKASRCGYTVKPLFRRHSRDQATCPLDEGWPPTNKIYFSSILPPNLLQLFQAPSQCIKKSWLTYLWKILCLDPTSSVHQFKWDSSCFESCLIVTSGHLNLCFLWLFTFWVLGCPLDGGLTWVLGPIKSIPFPRVEVFLE